MSCQQIGSEYQMSAIGVNLALLLAVLFLWGFIQLVLCAKLRTLSNFLSFAQMASVILSIGAQWPESVSRIVGMGASLLDFDVDVVNLGCVVNSSWRTAFAVQILFPVLFTVICCARAGCDIVLSRVRRRPKFSMEIRELKNGLIRVPLKFFATVYLCTSKYAASVFWCDEMSRGTEPSVKLLSIYPVMECGSAEHGAYQAVGIIVLAVFTLGFPCGLVAMLVHMNRLNLRTDINYIERFGWVYMDFEAKSFYFGALDVFRRMIFMVISRIPNMMWQSTLSIVLVMCYFALNLKVEP